MLITKEEIIYAIENYERLRDGVMALHPSRYDDVAEWLLILINARLKQCPQCIAEIETKSKKNLW